ncbi:GGDEF domain-containing protein [Novosphingobium sp.]|uniref:GGDEF domain-containing protein n=1 Tax=Novosphingobium sp. TaxID=1874826 RepID=UPI0035650842
MDDPDLRRTRFRLFCTGILVTLASVAASMFSTHMSFELLGGVRYSVSMTSAAIIPLMIAPAAYGWVAMLTMQLERKTRMMERLSRTDPLTSLPNRRAFIDNSERWLENGSLAVAMIDLDHFKQINDRLGHAGGDQALVHAAGLLRDTAPDGALVARLGGEEFGLICPLDGSPADLAEEVWLLKLDIMRHRLNSVPLITQGQAVHISASFGFAIMHAGDTLDSLLKRADTAMYEAKQAGRNCVRIAA